MGEELKSQQGKEIEDNDNEMFEKQLKEGKGKSVKLKSEYSDLGFTGRMVTADTEGLAVPDGTRRGKGNVWKIKVTGQSWGEGWITMPESELEFID